MVRLCSTPTSSLSSLVFSRKVGRFLDEMGLPYLGRRKGTEGPQFTETAECGRAEGSTACSPIRDSKTLPPSWWPDILMQKTAPQGAGRLIMTPSWWGSCPSAAAGLRGSHNSGTVLSGSVGAVFPHLRNTSQEVWMLRTTKKPRKTLSLDQNMKKSFFQILKSLLPHSACV